MWHEARDERLPPLAGEACRRGAGTRGEIGADVKRGGGTHAWRGRTEAGDAELVRGRAMGQEQPAHWRWSRHVGVAGAASGARLHRRMGEEGRQKGGRRHAETLAMAKRRLSRTSAAAGVATRFRDPAAGRQSRGSQGGQRERTRKNGEEAGKGTSRGARERGKKARVAR